MPLILTTKAGFSVKKYALGVDLTLRRLNVPIALIAGNGDSHDSRAIPFREEASHTSHTKTDTRSKYGEADTQSTLTAYRDPGMPKQLLPSCVWQDAPAGPVCLDMMP